MCGLICHIIASLWIFISTFIDEDEASWITDIMDEPDVGKYLFSMYFTITTITTVGYGDILASNVLERIMCMIIMLIGVLAFSFGTSMLI